MTYLVSLDWDKEAFTVGEGGLSSNPEIQSEASAGTGEELPAPSILEVPLTSPHLQGDSISPRLTHRETLRFFSPLAFSWLFMAIESPIALSAISRLPDPLVSTAAFFMMMGIAIWIESPVIDLLSTSVTLATDSKRYATISRFVWVLMGLVTLTHFTVVATPLYGFVSGSILNLSPEVSEATRLGLLIMTPWSAVIGWRRYLQGVLIRFGHTKAVGLGTASRLVTMATVTYGLFFTVELPSIAIVAIGLIASVAADAAFAHWSSRRIVRTMFGKERRPKRWFNLGSRRSEIVPSALGVEPVPEDAPLSFRELAAFHTPLTLTTMVMLVGSPLIGAFLFRTASPVLATAGWQVATTLLFLLRTVLFALPEVVIALYDRPDGPRVLRSFCMCAGAIASAVLLLFSFTGLDSVFFERVLGADPASSRFAHLCVLLCALTPLINAAQSYFRGELTKWRQTRVRLWAVLIGMSVLVASLLTCLSLGVRAEWMIATSLTLSMASEAVFLRLRAAAVAALTPPPAPAA